VELYLHPPNILSWCGAQSKHRDNFTIIIIIIIKSKGIVPVILLTDYHAIKAYWVNGGIAPRFLDVGTRWR
jgi:hypothetical protein